MTQTATTATTTVSRQMIEDFLIHEAELLDERRFEEWHALLAPDASYQIPLSDDDDPTHQAFLVNDDALRIEERVYKMSQVPFPSQSPPSRTLHHITNVRVSAREADSSRVAVRSNQLVLEMRLGDFRQVGLGEQRTMGADVHHELEIRGDSEIRIVSKVLHLLNRGAPIGNLTFIL